MAAIAKIRQRTGLLFIVIFVAMAAFILGDLFSGGGRGPQDQKIGKINGNGVSYIEFETRVQEEIDALRSIGQQTDDETTQNIRNQVWNQMVKEALLFNRMEEIGFRVTKEEYDDIRFGVGASASFKNDPTFTNPETGQFDPETVKNFFVMLQERFPLYWEVQYKKLVQNRLNEKYNNLVKKSAYANALDARFEHAAKETKANIEFAFQRYTNIADSTVTISDSELKAFYNKEKSKEKYKQDESRTLDFIVFPVEPSNEDKEELLGLMTELKSDFEKAESDSLFIINNADTPIYTPVEYKDGDLPKEANDLIINGEVNTVVGPYLDGDNYKLAYIKEKSSVKEVRARHILISGSKMSAAEAKKELESLRREAKSKNNFAELAKQKSDDPGSAANGGDLNFFGKGMMVPPFENACFNGKVGDMPIVETDYGVHLIEILENRNTPVYTISVLDKKVTPSVQTFNQVYNVASEFSINNSNISKFKSTAEEEGFIVQTANNITPTNARISNFKDVKEIVRWSYKSKKGSVSEPFEIDNAVFVVAALSEIKEEGIPSFEDLKEKLRTELINQKKAEKILNEIKGLEDLKTIAEKMGVTTKKGNSLAFNTFAMPSAGGSEPKVIGKIFATSPDNYGKVIEPIIGETGVYVLLINDITPSEAINDYADIKSTINRRIQNKASLASYNALVEKADVKDERGKVL